MAETKETSEKRTRLDPDFKYEVAEQPGGEHIKQCFACGTCTACCPVAEIDPDYNPRRIIRQILLGMRKEVLSSKTIWYCITCRACTATCPQNVKFSDVMGVLRDMAIQEGHRPPTILEDVEGIDVLAQQVRHRLVERLFEGSEPLSEMKTNLNELLEVE